MKKFKKIAAGLFAAATMATSVASINAFAYVYKFSLGMGETQYTAGHSRGTSDYGAIQPEYGLGSDVVACFCNASTYAQVSESVTLNTTSVITSWYTSGSYYDNVCLKITNGQSSRTVKGTYNPDGEAM